MAMVTIDKAGILQRLSQGGKRLTLSAVRFEDDFQLSQITPNVEEVYE
jgi:hypothetical protein